jgi:hypothetical protein
MVSDDLGVGLAAHLLDRLVDVRPLTGVSSMLGDQVTRA